MVREETKKSAQAYSKQANPVENSQDMENLFSPRFKSVAAMAGWDEEALLIASLVVEDTPDRNVKHKKRSDLQFKTPPSTNSRKKRRAQRSSPTTIPLPVLDLEEEESVKEERGKSNTETESVVKEEKREVGEKELKEKNSGVSCSNLALPCMDKLREELSCAICLEICFEPSTTTCGHSFCKKCLRSAADKCGKRCPKCRQLISNGRLCCTVNTVLWNTIQLLFPQEVEARKAASSSQEGGEPKREERGHDGNPRRSLRSQDSSRGRRRGELNENEESRLSGRFEREDISRLLAVGSGRRRERPSQDEDAALAFRLQREEFLNAFEEQSQSRRSSLQLARANLRAMASRAINTRRRNHQPV